MKTILIPVNFTDYSQKAVDFVINSFTDVNKIILLYSACSKGKTNAAFDPLEAQRLIGDQQMLIKNAGMKVETITSSMELCPLIERTIEQEKIDMVVMATKGSSSIREFRDGSIAGYVINATSIPVITIPKDYELRAIKNIVFAVDLKTYHDPKLVTNVVTLAKVWNARVHVVNIHGTNSLITREEIDAAKELEHQFHDVPHLFHFYNSADTAKGLDDFIAEYEADLLITVTRRDNKLKNVFHESITKRVAEQIHLPLIAFHD